MRVKNRIIFSLIFILSLAFTACGEEATPTLTPTNGVTQPAPTMTVTAPANGAEQESSVFVESVQVDKENGRVQLTISGNVSDACTEVVGARQEVSLETETFNVILETERPEDELCAQVLTPFEHTYTLNTADFSPGTYGVNVHGQTATFELTTADQDPGESVARITPDSGPPGTTVQLTATGLPADVEVGLGSGRVFSEYDIVDTTRTRPDGTLSAAVQIPEYADVGDEWVIVVEDPSGVTTISNEFRVTGAESGIDQTDIYLIAVADGGQRGDEIGCNDSVVPVTINIEPTIAPLTAALENLFTIDEEFNESGLYNVFHQSDLNVQGIDINNGHATIALEGEMLLGGICDNPRAEAQLEYTALQYSTIDSVSITLNGQPLEDFLSEEGP